ncbi:MAG: DNA polymerase I, partial [Gemmatimonadetes bacterium]|nr:DNA polymerase I [Gemmatimonadota bacterium]
QTAGEYGGRRQAAILGLIQNMVPVIDRQGILGLFTELEIPLLKVLAEMELAGIAIDSDIFAKMSQTLSGDLVLLRDDIYKIAGSQFNLNSPKQLQKILFEDLDLPIIKKNKSGPSTDSSVLEELAMRGHDIARLMLEYRELEKMRSTYVDALPKLVNSRTGRIHTQFNQTVAATGRLSSSHPNLQNIPSRTEMGRSIRKAFVAEPGFIFYAADYSQIELRVLAHLSNDQSLVQAFKKGMDIHKQTAAVIFDVEYDLVTKEQRAQAKTINFATLYGQGSFSLANQLGVSREQAQGFIDDYFERFGDVSNFFGVQVQKAQQEGFVETLMGRRRYVPELKSKQWNMRQFGERVAQNSPIQGTAADLIKKAMIGIANKLALVQSETRMLLQVHDELLFEVPLAEEKALETLVSREMEAAISLRVPLIVQGGFGRTWYDTKV